MVTEQAWAAFFFGGLSAVSVVIGAIIGVLTLPPQRAVAAIMAFGAGALLSALAFELILTAHQNGGFTPVAVGGIVGGVGFVILNAVLNGQGGFLRKPATTTKYLREQKRSEAQEVLAKLSRVPLFRALPPEEVAAVVPHLETVPMREGIELFRQGEDGDAFYLVDEGNVDLLVETEQQAASKVATLGPGDAFGEMALLTGEPRSATATAAGPAMLWKLPKTHFDALLAVSPGLSAAVGELLARNLQAISELKSVAPGESERWHSLARHYVAAHTSAPTATDLRKAAQEHSGSAATGIFLGLLLDGIPESLVIGMSMIGAPTVSAALIVGLFLSNLPEAMSSAVGMKAQGTGTARIVGMWTFLMVLTAVGAFFGNVLFLGAPIFLIAAFEAAAAGAMLTMIAETALPEAYEQGGWLSGLSTLLGFLAAFFVRTLGVGH